MWGRKLFHNFIRCVGYNNPNPENHVVCACTGKDDLWTTGPWMIVSGYPVAVKTSKPGGAEYLTIQASGYPDGPKPHYYTLVRPWDDFGEPTMPDLFPDGHLGVPGVFQHIALVRPNHSHYVAHRKIICLAVCKCFRAEQLAEQQGAAHNCSGRELLLIC